MIVERTSVSLSNGKNSTYFVGLLSGFKRTFTNSQDVADIQGMSTTSYLKIDFFNVKNGHILKIRFTGNIFIVKESSYRPIFFPTLIYNPFNILSLFLPPFLSYSASTHGSSYLMLEIWVRPCLIFYSENHDFRVNANFFSHFDKLLFKLFVQDRFTYLGL